MVGVASDQNFPREAPPTLYFWLRHWRRFTISFFAPHHQCNIIGYIDICMFIKNIDTVNFNDYVYFRVVFVQTYWSSFRGIYFTVQLTCVKIQSHVFHYNTPLIIITSCPAFMFLLFFIPASENMRQQDLFYILAPCVGYWIDLTNSAGEYSK